MDNLSLLRKELEKNLKKNLESLDEKKDESDLFEGDRGMANQRRATLAAHSARIIVQQLVEKSDGTTLRLFSELDPQMIRVQARETALDITKKLLKPARRKSHESARASA